VRTDGGRRRIAPTALSPRLSLRRAKTSVQPTPANSIYL
jgi:hypothetical protein